MKSVAEYQGKRVLIRKIGDRNIEEVFISNLSKDGKCFNVRAAWLYCEDYEVVGEPKEPPYRETSDHGITFDYC